MAYYPKNVPDVCKGRPYTCFACPFEDCVSGNLPINEAESEFRKCGLDGNVDRGYYKQSHYGYRIGGGTLGHY